MDAEPSAPSPFPPIPVEIVRYIFETAVRMGQDALSLALVSRVVNRWITPMIYHSVVLATLPESMDDIDDFVRILHSPRVNPSIGATVRRLILLKISWDATILLECPNLEVLMTDNDILFLSDLYIGRQFPAPSHILLVSSTSYQTLQLGHPLLRNVTHLYVDYPAPNILYYLAHLSRLTHVGIGCWGNADAQESCFVFISGALSRPSLKSVLVHAFEEHDGGPVYELVGHPWVDLAKIEDERLFAGPGFSDEDHTDFVLSGRSIWEHAAAYYRNWRHRVLQHY